MNNSMPVRVTDIRARFPELFTEFVGSADVQVENLVPPDLSNNKSIVFVTEPKFVQVALASPAPCLVLDLKSKSLIEAKNDGRCFLFSRNPKLAMAKVKAAFFAHEKPIQEIGTIHPTAVIDASAKLGKNVSVGPYSVIGRDVVIADDVRIDALVVIEADAKIGKGSHLYSHLYIGPRTEVGERCELQAHSAIGSEGFGFAHDERGHFHRIPQTGKVVLGNDVEVGSKCTIDRATFGATSIGEGCKIDKQSHIAHNCEIGKHGVMAGKFAVAGSAKIGDHFLSGGRVTVKDGVTVTNRVELAGLTGVQSDISESGQYGGFPYQPVRDAMRSGAALAFLPKIKKDVSKILKHLGLDQENQKEN